MHSQCAGGCGNIVVVLYEYLLQMLPLQTFDGQWFILDFDTFVTAVLVQGGNDFIGVRWLGQIVDGTEFDRFHRRRDAGKASQHDDAGVVIQFD